MTTWATEKERGAGVGGAGGPGLKTWATEKERGAGVGGGAGFPRPEDLGYGKGKRGWGAVGLAGESANIHVTMWVRVTAGA
jgi:hypothetical protein